MKKSLSEVPDGNLLLYQTEDGKTRIEVRLQGETVWLSLNQMAELFHRDKSVIPRHIRNIFEEGELPSKGVIANFATTASFESENRISDFIKPILRLWGHCPHNYWGFDMADTVCPKRGVADSQIQNGQFVLISKLSSVRREC
jgi:hypothetical protein